MTRISFISNRLELKKTKKSRKGMKYATRKKYEILLFFCHIGTKLGLLSFILSKHLK